MRTPSSSAASSTLNRGEWLGAAFFGSQAALVAGAVTVYDNASAASGNILYKKTMAEGEIATWASHGIAANNGLVVVAAGTVNVAYT